jgi:hypothetical protein
MMPVLPDSGLVFFRRVRVVLFSVISLVLSIEGKAQQAVSSPAVTRVSYVDTDLKNSQKYVLRVDGKPFYMTNIQVRLEKLRYSWGFDAAAREAIIAQAATDGFNTVSLPIHWYEVEPARDTFDWSVLDEYLGAANKYNLKVELLWFGQNSGGMVQWLTPSHLRVPDYVMYSPKRNSPATTSSYRIRRDLSPYTLDLDDKRLELRETYVLGRVMAHIAAWDKTRGNKHTVIGLQLNNEVAGFDFDGASFTAGQVVTYMNGLAGAVKKSPYVVWTRLNCIWGMEESRIDVNEALRSTVGTNIDFVGVDLYKASPAIIRSVLPYKGGNYRMIMECAAEVGDAARMQLAALSGNNAYDYYDLCGPDGHALYDRAGETGFKPHGEYVREVRIVNKLLNSDLADIAKFTQGYGLFVHNWAGNSAEPGEGVDGIVFRPASAASQAISIHRSAAEIVLMNTQGGEFIFPDSLVLSEANYGYFDQRDVWVTTGTLPLTGRSLSPVPGTTVRLIRKAASAILPATIRQAEFASYGLGSVVEAVHPGFAGNGYVAFNETGGYVRWSAIDGLKGGGRTIRIRYANGGKAALQERLLINKTPQVIFFPPTGSRSRFSTITLQVPLNSGSENRISVEWTEPGECFIDELQIVDK